MNRNADFFYKTNRFEVESIRITNGIESIRIANWNALLRVWLRHPPVSQLFCQSNDITMAQSSQASWGPQISFGNTASNAAGFLEAGSVRSLVVGGQTEAGFKRERFKLVTFTAVELTLKLHPTRSIVTTQNSSKQLQQNGSQRPHRCCPLVNQVENIDWNYELKT